MNLFYTPDIASDHYTLDETESRHCTRVLRLKEGDRIHLTDGIGHIFEAEIDEVQKRNCVVKVVLSEFIERRKFHIHIAVAPTKNIERLEWFLEKATEIGIDEITPILCEHSERKILRNDRLEKVILSAVKQSIKAYVPKLNELIEFDKFIRKEFNDRKFIAHLDKENPRQLADIYKKEENALIIIGPEGDFSVEEIKLAIENGFEMVALGNSRLRTETAALIACHTLHVLNQ